MRLSLLHRFLDPESGNGIGFCNICTDEQEYVSLGDVFERDGPAMRSLDTSHGLHTVDLTIASAAIQVVRADRQAHELLEEIQLFVGTAAGDQSAESLAAIALLESRKLLCGVLERLLPCRFNKNPVTSKQRLCQPVRMTRRMVAEEAARAEVAIVASGAIFGVDLDQFVVFRLDRNLAAIAAELANRIGSFHHPGAIFVHRQPARDGADRANLHTTSAKFAIQGVRAEGFDLRHRPAS